MYQITSNGLRKIDTVGKDNLPLGTKLYINGYGNTYVITGRKNTAAYFAVNVETHRIRIFEPYALEFIKNKKDSRIQVYILDDVEPNWLDLKAKALDLERKNIETKKLAAIENERILAEGEKLLTEKRPKWAKAVIIAYFESNVSDSMTDYFALTKGKIYILAWSKHKRNLFSEMRKAAAKMDETKHLSMQPKYDVNGDVLTEGNKRWWKPRDQDHDRMVLKNNLKYSSDWVVCKMAINSDDTYNCDLKYALAEGRYLI